MLSTVSIGVIADDFTGALDTGAQFALANLETMLLLKSGGDTSAQVLVLNTNSRAVNPGLARQLVVQASRCLDGRRLFKKIDSTMRGRVGPEILAILNSTRYRKAVICPAIIDGGRSVQEGKLLVNGVLLRESSFAHDPRGPGVSSDLADLIQVPVTHLGMEFMRGGSKALIRAIDRSHSSLFSLDAGEETDLDLISQAIIGGNYLPCGALGLARAWIQQLGRNVQKPNTLPVAPVKGPLLFIVGSPHPTTRSQVNLLQSHRGTQAFHLAPELDKQGKRSLLKTVENHLENGRSVVFQPVPASNKRIDGWQLGTWTAMLNNQSIIGALVMTGGETANSVCAALGADAVEILGELETGISLGRLVGGHAPDLPIVTKAGGFGRADTLIRILDRLYPG